MQPLKKFSPESIRAIARNPNIDLQLIGVYSKSDIQHHIRTQQFQELLTKMDTIQRQSIDQNLRKLLAFLGWPYYILEILTVLYAMFNFLGFFLSPKKNLQCMRNTHTSK